MFLALQCFEIIQYETIIVDNAINLVPSDPSIQHTCPNSTHFIVGIQWGVIGILMLKSKVHEWNDEASIRAALKVWVSIIIEKNVGKSEMKFS